MLQPIDTFRPEQVGGREPDLISLQETFSSMKALVLRQFPLMLVVGLACLSIAGVYLLTAPQRYSSTAELIIDSRKSQMLQQQSPLGVELPLDSATVDSQVEILKSENVALSVINDLRLMDEPEFTGPGTGLIGRVVELVSSILGSEGMSEYQRTRTALTRFQDRLTIKRNGLSYVIEITFDSIDPERAARIANAVADAYIVDSLEAKYQASRRAATWLQDRMKELRAQASAAERGVADFKAKNNIVDAGGRLLTEQQLAEVNSALTIARAQRAEAEARSERINTILQNEKKEAKDLLNDIATVTDSLRNDVITRLRQQYLDLAAREADWASRYGSGHLAVVNLRNQMREIRKSITDELRRIAETYKSDLEIAKAREASAQKTLDDAIAQSNDTSQAQIVLRDLESNAQSSRALADNFLQLYMVSIQQQSFPMTEARLITRASAPLKPSSPKIWLVGVIGLLAGSVLAFGAGLCRDLLDRVFRTSSQIETALGVACLAIIPEVSDGATSEAASKTTAAESVGVIQRTTSSLPSGAGHIRQIAYRSDMQKYVMNAPFTRFTESIRTVKMAIELDALSQPRKTIGITSSLPNEGKSTVSLSLAQLIAQGGIRTLLVDGDIRNPSLTDRLTPDAEVGMLDVMLKHATLENAIWTDPSTGLDFLPCVVQSRISNTSEILSSVPMERLFRELGEKYDRIILDLSPLAPVIDVRGTGKIVDAYLLIVEWARTRIEMVDHALSDAPNVRKHLLGALLNKVDIAAMNRYDPYHGNRYYDQYYQRYGYID